MVGFGWLVVMVICSCLICVLVWWGVWCCLLVSWMRYVCWVWLRMCRVGFGL